MFKYKRLMKPLFAFTLFSITSLFITNVAAYEYEEEEAWLNGAWYGNSICLYVEFPWAIAYPYAFIWNDSDSAIRWYYTAEASLTGPDPDDPKEDDDDGLLKLNDWTVSSNYFRFNIRHKDAGEYTLSGSSWIRSKNWGGPKPASTSYDFIIN